MPVPRDRQPPALTNRRQFLCFSPRTSGSRPLHEGTPSIRSITRAHVLRG
jgi:hypothetical protein